MPSVYPNSCRRNFPAIRPINFESDSYRIWRLHHLPRILFREMDWSCKCNWVVYEARSESMKVVLFCGGYGLRIRDAENIPKPLAQIGYRPVIWHVMKYYAHYGHKDFILCLGYGADQIKR